MSVSSIIYYLYKDLIDSFTCNIGLGHRHNHPISSFEEFNFKAKTSEVKREVNSLFANNFAPSQVYSEFLMNSKNNYDDELNFHLQKSHQSKCTRYLGFNSLPSRHLLRKS